MAKYIVRVWDVESITKDREVSRATLNAAWFQFDKAVYDVLKAFGKLDTLAAWKAKDQAHELRDILQIGEERGFLVSNSGKSVKIIRES